MILVTMDKEDLLLIIDFLHLGIEQAKKNIEAEKELPQLALRMQHEVDQAYAVLEQLENMEHQQ